MTTRLTLMTAAAVLALTGAAYAEHGAPHDGEKPDGKAPQKMLEKADADGDGAISKAEFMAIHEKRFAEMDTNGDGKIAQDEIAARRAAWQEKMKELRAAREARKAEGSVPAPKTPEAPAE